MTEPWGLTGTDFLVFFCMAYLAAAMTPTVARAVLCRTGVRRVARPDTPLDRYQIAYLVGGPQRVVSTVLAHLTLSGVVLVARDGTLTTTSESAGLSPVEAAVVWRMDHVGGRRNLDYLSMDVCVLDIGAELRARGLLLSSTWLAALRVVALAPAVVWGVGLIWVIEEAWMRRPVGGFVFCLFVTAILTIWVVVRARRRAAECVTIAGRRALRAARDRYEAQTFIAPQVVLAQSLPWMQLLPGPHGSQVPPPPSSAPLAARVPCG